jgi:hypothetical protein
MRYAINMRAMTNRPAGAASELSRVAVYGIVAAGPATKIRDASTMRALRLA